MLPLTWFDAHLDLAYLAVNGRDMLAPLAVEALPHPPAACTLPALKAGKVRMALGTIFTEPEGSGPEGYPRGSLERAYAVGRAQLEVYLTWRDRGIIGLELRSALAGGGGADVGEVRGGMGVTEVVPLSTAARLARLRRDGTLHIGILVENADPIRSPDELSFWVDRGVVAVGLTWATGSRYAGGNSSHGPLSDLGRELIREMDRLNVIHDVSHLSDEAFENVLDATPRMVIASHSNARSLIDSSGANQRHLTDAQIREIARRGGVIGLNLFSRFLVPSGEDRTRATIAECIRQVEYIAEIAHTVSPFGDGRKHVGLGSDLDGGFSAAALPQGIDSPEDYARLGEALSTRGWYDEQVADFACGNWMRVFA